MTHFVYKNGLRHGASDKHATFALVAQGTHLLVVGVRANGCCLRCIPGIKRTPDDELGNLALKRTTFS